MTEPGFSSPTEQRENMKQAQNNEDQESFLKIMNSILHEDNINFLESIKTGENLIKLYRSLTGKELAFNALNQNMAYVDNHCVFMKASGLQYDAAQLVQGKADHNLAFSLLRFVNQHKPEHLDGQEKQNVLTLSQCLNSEQEDEAAALASIILGASGQEITEDGILQLCKAAGIEKCKWAGVFAQYFRRNSLQPLIDSVVAGGSSTGEPQPTAAKPVESKKEEKSEEEAVIGGFMMDSSSSESEDSD